MGHIVHLHEVVYQHFESLQHAIKCTVTSLNFSLGSLFIIIPIPES